MVSEAFVHHHFAFSEFHCTANFSPSKLNNQDFKRRKKQRILVRVPAIAKDINIRLSDGKWTWFNNFAFPKCQIVSQVEIYADFSAPHRAHKLCKPSWGKETIKYKPWDIYLHYCCHVLKSKIHFCAIKNLYKMYNNHKRGSCLLQKVDFKKCRKNTSRKR